MTRTSGLIRRLGVAASRSVSSPWPPRPGRRQDTGQGRRRLHRLRQGPQGAQGRRSPATTTTSSRRTRWPRAPRAPPRGVSAAAFAPAVTPGAVPRHPEGQRQRRAADLSDARIDASRSTSSTTRTPAAASQFVLEQTTTTRYAAGVVQPDRRQRRRPAVLPRQRQGDQDEAGAYGDSDSETLNIYSASLGQSLLGWAYFPSDFDPEFTGGNPLPSYFDGVVVDFRSLPTVPNDTGDSRAYDVYGARRHGHARGRPLARALPHLPGRLCGPTATSSPTRPPRRRPPSRARSARDTCAGRRRRPDPQLHGLHLRRVHVRVHRWPADPDAGHLDAVPRPALRPVTRAAPPVTSAHG